jgi:hypothetical protein
MRRFLSPLAALLLAGCQPGPPAPASQYRQAEIIGPLSLWFAPGGTRLSATDMSQLHTLARRLPADVVPDFYAGGPLAPARAQAVERQLGRPVRLLAATDLPAEQTSLVTRMPDGIIADACRGAGQRTLGDAWPGDDATAPVLLPPGCATATDIQAQVTNPQDLLRGRPLPPAAASPYAAAIERYYRRNDAPQATGGSEGNGGSGSQDQTAQAGASPGLAQSPGSKQGSGATNGSNPLFGGLPP